MRRDCTAFSVSALSSKTENWVRIRQIERMQEQELPSVGSYPRRTAPLQAQLQQCLLGRHRGPPRARDASALSSKLRGPPRRSVRDTVESQALSVSRCSQSLQSPLQLRNPHRAVSIARSLAVALASAPSAAFASDSRFLNSAPRLTTQSQFPETPIRAPRSTPHQTPARRRCRALRDTARRR